jgi:hypothetical protein
MLTSEEEEIILDLDTTELYKMRGRIKHYILNTVQLERESYKIKQEKLENKI